MDSDSEETDDFVSYGTPLDPIDEDAIPRKKPLSLGEQVVLDKQGRRRFHGAFTGGFSAGFFNTVGSLEGWTPSTFKSSRSQRRGNLSQKPEDFMDEEDMDEFGIAPRVIRPTSDYRERPVHKRKYEIPKGGPIPGVPVLHLLLQPARDTIGVRLLKNMGWKPGQGIGPRLTKKEKKQAAKQHKKLKKKVYGCPLPDELKTSSADHFPSESSNEEESDEEEILYAPDDIEPFKCVPKNDNFGLGYKGLDRRPILFSDKLGPQKKSYLNMVENKKKISITGQAFGVGAFEEEDEDIYSTEDMSHYDFMMEETEEKKLEPKKSSRWDHPHSSHAAEYAGEPLEGFVLAEKKSVVKNFPPPTLPPNYRPMHLVRKSRFEPVEEKSEKEISRKKGLGRHDLTAADRQVILSGPKEQTDPVVNIEKLENNLRSSADATSSSPVPETVFNKDKLQFKPFVADPDKQRRYEQYLGLLKFNQKHRLSELQPLSMTEWERDRERMEFEQASRLYQPLSGAMSDRFVSATHPDVGDDGNPSVVLAREEESERKKAAKMKMFGKLTRDKIPWIPCSLLYKRFNVPDPGLQSEPVVKKHRSKFSVFDFLASQPHNSLSSKAEELPPEQEKSISNTSEKSNEDEPVLQIQMQKISSIPKPIEDALLSDKDPPNKIDLYKAIFLSTSESESDGEPGPEESNEKSEFLADIRSSVLEVSKQSIEVSELNVKRNNSPSRGVFANLDLDAINVRSKINEDKETIGSSQVEDRQTSNVMDVDIDSGVYGPRIPSHIIQGIRSRKSSKSSPPVEVRLSESTSSSEGEWIEKSSPRKHKKNKHSKSRHKKSKKHKHKHKHKKR